MTRGMITFVVTILAVVCSARADTTAEFALIAPAEPTIAWGTELDVTVAVTHNERLAACVYRIDVSGTGGARLIQRTVAPSLRYLGTNSDAPLADGLPENLSNGDVLADVFLNLDTADPPGNPSDGLAPGFNVVIATYTLVATDAGALTLTLTAPQAAETQSDPDGTLFDAVALATGGAQVSLTITGGPDINGDAHVDLRDFARVQECLSESPIGVCATADVDGDGDVDHADFQIVLDCLGGPAGPVACSE